MAKEQLAPSRGIYEWGIYFAIGLQVPAICGEGQRCLISASNHNEESVENGNHQAIEAKYYILDLESNLKLAS
jgi:hypothetical protein